MTETGDAGFSPFTDREWLLFRVLLVVVIATTSEKIFRMLQEGYF